MPIHLGVGDQRPQPVRGVEHLRPGDPREQVLVPAGEPHHLVGKHRADEEGEVVFKRGPVDQDRHLLAEEPARDLPHLLRRDGPHLGQGVWVIPTVLEDRDPWEVP